jgi:hypothetical protein
MLKEAKRLKSDMRRLGAAVFVTAALLVLLAVVVSRTMLTDFSMHVFESITEPRPMVLLTPVADVGVFETLYAKMAALKTPPNGSAKGQPIALSMDEINMLISAVPRLRSTIRVTSLARGELKVLLSMPFVYRSRLRYLNGVAKASVKFSLGFLRVNLQDLEVHGQTLPALYTDSLKEVNLTGALYAAAQEGGRESDILRDLLWNIREITFGDGQVEIYGL